MRIFPNPHNASQFTITDLDDQELRNLAAGLANKSYHPDSPWSKGAIEQIEAALRAQEDYLSKSW